ncbi:MAG TPA: cupin domain-containing protein [Gemmatimonadales bacterium]|nr:cupin domain-containing protein [Gemmatimonadales bacterium]
MDKVSLNAAFARISEHWRPKVIAELNGQEVKAVKVKGEFVWHHHDVEDELFLVHKGRLRMEFRDRVVELGPGECLVVPHGVEHRPVAEEEVEMILFEPCGVLNTGNVTDAKLTAPKGAKL